jgi:hypothetical protein
LYHSFKIIIYSCLRSSLLTLIFVIASRWRSNPEDCAIVALRLDCFGLRPRNDGGNGSDYGDNCDGDYGGGCDSGGYDGSNGGDYGDNCGSGGVILPSTLKTPR